MQMNRFYLARLLDEDGDTLASDQVWFEGPTTLESIALDAAGFFSGEHHEDPTGQRILLFGPFDVMTPTACFTVSEPPEDADGFSDYTVTREAVERPGATITAEHVGGSKSGGAYEVLAHDDDENRVDKSTVSAADLRATIAEMSARLEAEGYAVTVAITYPRKS